MNMRVSVFSFILILVKLATPTHSQGDYFINPPSAGPAPQCPTNDDLSQNLVYRIGDLLTLEWVANFTDSTIIIWSYESNLNNLIETGRGVGTFNVTSQTFLRKLNWTVGPPLLLQEWPGDVWFFQVSPQGDYNAPGNPAGGFLCSRTFNITNSTGPIASQAPVTSITATPTASTPSASASPPSASPASTDDRNSDGLKIGLGVGLALGIPLAVLVGVVAYWFLVRRQRTPVSKAAMVPPEYELEERKGLKDSGSKTGHVSC